MARRYARDNRGRFASSGSGATARGGRLKTASGNKRQGQSMQVKGGPKGTIGKPKGLKPGAIQPRATTKPAARRDKLQSGPLAGASDFVKQGLRGMGNRAINRVETAARLSELQKAGKLNRLSPSQSRRAQSVFNDAQRKVSVAPRIYAEQRRIQLAIKADKMRRNGAAAAKPAAKAGAKVNLSQTAFERRAKITEKRARAAEKAVAGVDRAYTANRRAFRTADALRSAADSYASYARRGKNNPDFTAADLFKGRARRSTAPKLSKSEKAAATRRANADQRFRDNVRRMEADRRRR